MTSCPSHVAFSDCSGWDVVTRKNTGPPLTRWAGEVVTDIGDEVLRGAFSCAAESAVRAVATSVSATAKRHEWVVQGNIFSARLAPRKPSVARVAVASIVLEQMRVGALNRRERRRLWAFRGSRTVSL